MRLNLYHLIYKPRRRNSLHRRGMIAASLEGFPAVLLTTFLNPPFLTGYLLFLGATSFQIGMVLAIPSLANVVQVVMALFMQRLENRRLAVVVLAGMHRLIWTSTGLIPFLFPKAYWMAFYIPIYLLAFLSNSAGGVIWSSLISDIVPPQVRGRYFGIRNMLLGAFTSLVLYVGGLIMDRYPGEHGFSILFDVSWAAALLNIVALSQYPNLPFEKSRETDKSKLILAPFRNSDFSRAMIFISVWLFLQGLAVPFFSYVMLDILHIDYKYVSIVTIVQNVVMMMSYLVWGNLNMRMSTRKLMLWTFPIVALSCLAWGGILWVPAAVMLIVIHFLLGFGTGGFNQLVFNFVIGDTPKGDRPMYIAVFNALTGIMAFAGSSTGGLLYEALKHAPRWVEVSGLSFGVGAVLLFMSLVLGPAVFSHRPKFRTRSMRHTG